MGGVPRSMREIVARIPEQAILPTGPTSASLEEERGEILTSVMGVLVANSSDPDEMAACSYLLKHLTQYRMPSGPQRVESVMMDS
jgi:hypothetical protein